MADDTFLPPQPPRPFIGRKTEIEWLEQEIWGGEFARGRPVVVTGAPGIGKTALVAEALFRQRYFSISVSTQRGHENPEPARRMTNGARPNLPVWMAAKSMMENFEEFRALMKYRSEQRDERDVIVVLDGLDELPEEQRSEATSRIFNYKLIKSLIVTSRVETDMRGERILRLEGLSKPDAESLISDISGSLVTPGSMRKILGIGGGNPVTLSLIAELARKIDPEQLGNALDGHLYDIKDTALSERTKLLAAARPIVISANEVMICALKKRPEDVDKITPRQFEELIAELLRDMGHEVTLTKATRDGGKDILAGIKTELGDFLCLVEAKRHRADRPVGVSLVRSLYGTLCDYKATSAMLVTTSRFSPDAHALQRKHPHELSLRDQIDVARWIHQYGNHRLR